MEAVKVLSRVGKDGLHIDFKDVAKFENSEVEILIFPSTESKKTDLHDFAGSVTREEAEEMEQAVSECRTINTSEW